MQRRSEVAWGLYLSFLCPEAVRMGGRIGFEWLFLDAERLPLTHQTCGELVREADAAGIRCLVRVPQIKASIIEGFLDAGVLGILAPHVSTARDAQTLVQVVRSRGNPRTFTIALVESQEGIDHLEEILAVPGLDYMAIGPNDLARSMGIEGGITDLRIRTLVKDAQARIRAAGKPQVAVVSDANQAREAIAAGATMIAVSDAALLTEAGRAFLQSF
jgi:4-hydroxy-2-oxoheptanedioate aldolase